MFYRMSFLSYNGCISCTSTFTSVEVAWFNRFPAFVELMSPIALCGHVCVNTRSKYAFTKKNKTFSARDVTTKFTKILLACIKHII